MNTKTKKEEYIKFCENNPIPVFSQAWWLDAVCGAENWDVILVKKGENILASMPYFLQKRSIFNTIYMPPLTQTLGPFVKYEQNINVNKIVSYENKVFAQIIEQIPKTAFFFQNFHYSVTNWLPFYWAQYKQTSYYTYIVENIKDEDRILKNFSYSKRTEVKKAIKASLELVQGLDAETFYLHHKQTLAEKNQKATYPKSVLYDIIAKAKELGKGEILGVKNPEGELLCCVLLIWDDKSAYNLATSINNKSREYNASSFMFYEAIKYASKFVDVFDFEGSMVPSIENSYRQFGTKQVPYFRVTKANNILLKVAEALHTSKSIK